MGVREFCDEDRGGFARLALDDAMFEFMMFRWQDEVEAAREFDRVAAMDRAEPRRHFALALDRASDQSFLGIVGLEVMGEGAAEFGWYLPSPCWGHGYASEATQLLLQFGFVERGFERMIAKCDPENTRSQRVLERAGLELVPDSVSTVVTWRGERPRIWFELHRQDWTPRQRRDDAGRA